MVFEDRLPLAEFCWIHTAPPCGHDRKARRTGSCPPPQDSGLAAEVHRGNAVGTISGPVPACSVAQRLGCRGGGCPPCPGVGGDLDQADQRDLQALVQALERRLGERVSSNESKQLLASHRRREEESLGVYAADVQLLTRRSYPEFSAATREALALHAFLRGLQPESLGQHVRLTAPQTLDAALDQAERAEVELCRRPDGASVDAAGAAAAPGTKNVEVKSRQRKGRIRTATLAATETAEASLAQCRQLGLVEDCGWTGQRATHPHRSRRRGRRKARRRSEAEDGVPERRSRGPLQRNLVGAPMEVVPDHNPRTATDCWRQASQPEGKAAPQRGRYWPGPRRRRWPPEQSGLCSGCWGRRDV
ncbi:unnamed protein product [Boreogadus saida]